MGRTKPAAKADPTRPVDEEKPTYPIHFIKATLLVTALASASLATQLSLHPLYGSAPPFTNHSKVLLLACLLSALFPLHSRASSERVTLLGLASWLGYAPYASFAIGKWTTSYKNPVLGATIAEAAILVPTVSIGITVVRRWSVRFVSPLSADIF